MGRCVKVPFAKFKLDRIIAPPYRSVIIHQLYKGDMGTKAECHTKCNTYIYFASSMLIRVCLGRKGRNYISFYTIWTKIGEKSKISQKFHQKWVRPSLSISQYPINWAMICHLNSPFFKSIISLGEGCAHNLTAIQVRYWEQAECHTKCNTYIYFASSMLIRVCLGRKGRNYISIYTE